MGRFLILVSNNGYSVWDWRDLLLFLRQYLRVLDVRVGRLYVEVMVLGDVDDAVSLLRGLGDVVGVRDVDHETPSYVGFRGFVKLFNQWRFWEAHEVLELEWRRSVGAAREVLQGFIQLAAAFVHWQHENELGYRKLLSWSMSHLSNYGGDDYFGVSVGKVLMWERDMLRTPIRETRPPLL